MKAAVRALNKFIAKNFSEEQIDEMGFFPDTENHNSYSFNIELDKKRYELTYLYDTKKVEMVRIN